MFNCSYIDGKQLAQYVIRGNGIIRKQKTHFFFDKKIGRSIPLLWIRTQISLRRSKSARADVVPTPTQFKTKNCRRCRPS